MLGSPDKELGQMIMGFKDSNLGLELFVIRLNYVLLNLEK